MIANEEYWIDKLAKNYGNAVGDTPVAFDWIGGQTFNGVQMTGIHSIVDHGLKVGDFVNLVSTNPRYTGKFQVKAIGDDADPAWASTIFNIAVVKQGASETASGTWQRTIGCTATETLTDGVCKARETGITIAGFTLSEIGEFLFGLLLVGMALPIILKVPTKIEGTI
jgi:hypothetical protein